MKAEHRKELETNILADKMGKLITGAKHGPSRGFLFYLVIGLAILFVLFLIYRWTVQGSTKNAGLWPLIEMGDAETLAKIAEQAGNDNPGKTARFQLAWRSLWYGGINQLGVNPKNALRNIDNAESLYLSLAKESKGDPVFEPEALYGIAVIEETRLVKKENRANLAGVVEKYEAVVKSSKDSAFGRLAQQRLDDLNDNVKSAQILTFYNELDGELARVDRMRAPEGIDIEELMKKFKAEQKNP